MNIVVSSPALGYIVSSLPFRVHIGHGVFDFFWLEYGIVTVFNELFFYVFRHASRLKKLIILFYFYR